MNDSKYKINIINDMMSKNPDDPDFFPIITDDDTEMKSEEGKTEKRESNISLNFNSFLRITE